MQQIFILSPASTTGKRAGYVLNDGAQFDIARRLRSNAGAPLGEVFSFLSGLYFRGKLAYGQSFARPPARLRGCYVITSNAGLVPAETPIDLPRLKGFADTPIDLAELRYCEPLRRTARRVNSLLGDGRAVLLGSIATPKYVDLLVDVFGDRLVFPREFVGRGDMSRGGLLLRAVRSGMELAYASVVDTTVRTGRRPPKLEPVAPKGAARSPRRRASHGRRRRGGGCGRVDA